MDISPGPWYLNFPKKTMAHKFMRLKLEKGYGLIVIWPDIDGISRPLVSINSSQVWKISTFKIHEGKSCGSLGCLVSAMATAATTQWTEQRYVLLLTRWHPSLAYFTKISHNYNKLSQKKVDSTVIAWSKPCLMGLNVKSPKNCSGLIDKGKGGWWLRESFGGDILKNHRLS